MAHFAEIDSNNTVLRVVVISNEDLLDKNGVEKESLGIQVCKNIFGSDTNWVQTSYSGTFRHAYAGPGFMYDKERDAFITPQPKPWFVLNNNHDWECPIGVHPETGEPLTAEELEWLETVYAFDNNVGS